MPDDEVIDFKLDSGVVVGDLPALLGWIEDQAMKRSDQYEFVYASEEFGDRVVSRENPDVIYDLDDILSLLQLVADMIIGTVPGLVEVDSYWNVDRRTD